MNLSIFGLENQIIFEEGYINILEINNKFFFSSIINLINEKCNGNLHEDNQILLKQDNQILKIDKNIILITDLFNLDFNSKKILNKIYNIISDNINNNQDFKLEELTLKLKNYLISEINELPFEFTIKSEIEIDDLLKIFNLKIDNTCYITLVEKIEFIINLISTLELAKILVIPNLKTFLNKEELLEIYKYSIYNNINLLIIENKNQNEILKYEQVNIIDEEFDEFLKN